MTMDVTFLRQGGQVNYGFLGVLPLDLVHDFSFNSFSVGTCGTVKSFE
jgi:hypothetical protein